MSNAQTKKWVTLLVVCVAGLVFQLLPTGCVDYAVVSAVQSVDFCSIFNCSGGTFVDLCNPVPLLADCPEAQAAAAE